jgi:AraC-like DNA-binding protein
MSEVAPALGVTDLVRRMIAEIDRRVGTEGVIGDRRIGSTIYQVNRPSHPRLNAVGSLSLVFIAQSGDASTAIGGQRLAGGINYLVEGVGAHVDCQIIQASIEHPVLFLVVPIDPQLVRSAVASVRDLGLTVTTHRARGKQHSASVADAEMSNAIWRFLRSMRSECDRRALAPLVLQEMVYRVLLGDQGQRLMQMAAQQAKAHPVGAAVAYIDSHLAEPLTVDALAARACLSPSTFSRVFRETLGSGPYQYVKEARLDHARRLLEDGRCTVADAARQVGYVSVSNFIKAFRRRFGVTPGSYLNTSPFRDTSRIFIASGCG